MEKESGFSASVKKRTSELARIAGAGTQIALAPVLPAIPLSHELYTSPIASNGDRVVTINTVPSQEIAENLIYTKRGDHTSHIDEEGGFLESDTARILLSLGTLYAIAAGAQSYMLGKKYDEETQERIRNTASAFLVGGTSLLTAEAFNLIDVDSHIPSAMIMSFAWLHAAHTIRNTWQIEANPKIRATSVATAALFATLGTTLFLASDKLR